VATQLIALQPIDNDIARLSQMQDIEKDSAFTLVPSCFQSQFALLYAFAQDYVSAPASQAYSECVFSLCGNLPDPKQNGNSSSLEKQVFLKINTFYI
jgi:hypothetical protein